MGTVGSTDEKAPHCQTEFMIHKANWWQPALVQTILQFQVTEI